jgi:hypothetical protein
MKYAVEMGSGIVLYVWGFVKIGLGIQEYVGGYTGRRRSNKSTLEKYAKNVPFSENPFDMADLLRTNSTDQEDCVYGHKNVFDSNVELFV